MEHLKTLRGLNEDEVSENAMLRSRIDQQSELICILKRRADEYLEKCLSQDKELNELQGQLQVQTSLAASEKKQSILIRDRFDKLDQNHIELIKIKDELKADNEKLRASLKQLQRENTDLRSGADTDKDKKIVDLETEVKQFAQKVAVLEDIEKTALKEVSEYKMALTKKAEEKQTEVAALKASHKDEITSLMDKLSLNELELRKMKEALAMSGEEGKSIESTVADLTKELKEKTNQIARLQENYVREQKKAKDLDEKFAIEKDKVSKSEKVKKLQKNIEELQDEKVILVRQFDAFKQHTSSLLQSERELNKKLRRLKSAGIQRPEANT